jgi:hypothetical protein
MADDPRFEAFGRHGSSIRDELGVIFDDARFEDWVSGAAERRIIFADKIIGSISWSKELGRPQTGALSDGFVVEHWWWNPEVELGPTGEPSKPKGWTLLEPPFVWDGPEDETRYQVGLFDDVGGLIDEKIVARLAEHPWEGGGLFSGPRRVEPSEIAIGQPTGNPVRVSFSVVSVPHLRP